MSTLRPLILESSNLSTAWGMALNYAFETSKRSLSPLVLSISDFQSPLPPEDSDLRRATDDELARHGMNSVAVSGLVIFPLRNVV